jgi:hypothetical protein
MIINAANRQHTITNAPMIFQVSASTLAHGEAVNPSVMRSMRTLVLPA